MKAPRGFKYGLEPLRVKSAWDLLEVQQHVAACLRAVDETRSQVEQLSSAVEAEQHASRRAGSQVGHLVAEVERMRRSYLGLLGGKLNQAQHVAQRLAQQHDTAVLQATRLQRFTDGIEQHWDEQVREHISAVAVGAGKEADDAWAQRNFHLKNRDARATT